MIGFPFKSTSRSIELALLISKKGEGWVAGEGWGSSQYRRASFNCPFPQKQKRRRRGRREKKKEWRSLVVGCVTFCEISAKCRREVNTKVYCTL